MIIFNIFFYEGVSNLNIEIFNNFFVIQKKKKKLQGFQVAPAELEAILLTHPLILDSAVIGVYSKDEETEKPVAYIVPKHKSQCTKEFSEEIKKFVDEKVASHKKLRGGVTFIDQIPKSASGKILRRKLRENHS